MKLILSILISITVAGCISKNDPVETPETLPCLHLLESLHTDDLSLFKSVWSSRTYAEYEKLNWDTVFAEWKTLSTIDANPQNYEFEFTRTEKGADVFFRHNTGQLLSPDALPVINESGKWKIDMPE